MDKKIYIIDNYFCNTGNSAISNIAYANKIDAIKHIESKLTDIEKQSNKELKEKGLLCWFEFKSKNIIYTIRDVEIQ